MNGPNGTSSRPQHHPSHPPGFNISPSESAGTCGSMERDSNGTAFSGTPEPKGSITSRSEISYPVIDSHRGICESKENRKIVRFVTVIAYIFFVSLAAIVLSLYYFFLWDPRMQERPFPETMPGGPQSMGGMSSFAGGSGMDGFRGRKRVSHHNVMQHHPIPQLPPDPQFPPLNPSDQRIVPAPWSSDPMQSYASSPYDSYSGIQMMANSNPFDMRIPSNNNFITRSQNNHHQSEVQSISPGVPILRSLDMNSLPQHKSVYAMIAKNSNPAPRPQYSNFIMNNRLYPSSAPVPPSPTAPKPTIETESHQNSTENTTSIDQIKADTPNSGEQMGQGTPVS